MKVTDNVLKNSFLYILVLASLTIPSCEKGNQPIDVKKLRESVETRVMSMNHADFPTINGNLIRSAEALIKFYEARKFEPAWINHQGFRKFIDQVIQVVYGADKEGLEPSDYHLKELFENYTFLDFYLKGKRKRKQDMEAFANFELLLTDAYLTYAGHIYYGKVCPDNVDPDWHAPCKTTNIDLADYLAKAMEDDLIGESLERLKPRNAAYNQLKMALAFYKKLDLYGVEEDLVFKQPLSVVDSNKIYIKNLKTFLRATGDLSTADFTKTDELMCALQQFQERHGLIASGFLDSLTMKALHSGFKEKIKTLEVNMERWRWLPMDLGREYLVVNIADFTLKIIKENRVVFESRVVVGDPFHRTPVFSAEMTHLILNPYWLLPESIVENEILTLVYPEEFLIRNRIEVCDDNNCPVPLDSIDWEAARIKGLPYQLRQEPGPANALGLIKFVFPNDYLVFIHDTPAKSLFKKNVRAFSHGCIRLQQPFALAVYLLQNDPQWDLHQLRKFTQNQDSVNRRIDLPEPMPVHVLYWTTWVDEEGLVYFREDIYDRDAALWEALKEEGGENRGL